MVVPCDDAGRAAAALSRVNRGKCLPRVGAETASRFNPPQDSAGWGFCRANCRAVPASPSPTGLVAAGQTNRHPSRARGPGAGTSSAPTELLGTGGQRECHVQGHVEQRVTPHMSSPTEPVEQAQDATGVNTPPQVAAPSPLHPHLPSSLRPSQVARVPVSSENSQRTCPCVANPRGSHFYRLSPGHTPNPAPPLKEGKKSPFVDGETEPREVSHLLTQHRADKGQSWDQHSAV